MRMDIGRLREVGSRISWVMWVWLGCTKMSFSGKNKDMLLSRSGKILFLVSAVPLHLVSRCTMSSMGAGSWGDADKQRRHSASLFLSLPRYE